MTIKHALKVWVFTLLCALVFIKGVEMIPTNSCSITTTIRDVYYDEFDDTTELICNMPNGELHRYYVNGDAREGKEVIFVTSFSKRNDYTSYEARYVFK